MIDEKLYGFAESSVMDLKLRVLGNTTKLYAQTLTLISLLLSGGLVVFRGFDGGL